jgi:hypothetical protein
MPVGDGAEELGNRLVGKGTPRGPGGCGQDSDPIPDVFGKFLYEAGLADAGLARDQYDLAAAGSCL